MGGHWHMLLPLLLLHADWMVLARAPHIPPPHRTPASAPRDPAFPCLQRDDAINAGFAWFREKGLIPANDSSDDDVNYAEAAGVEW